MNASDSSDVHRAFFFFALAALWCDSFAAESDAGVGYVGRGCYDPCVLVRPVLPTSPILAGLFYPRLLLMLGRTSRGISEFCFAL
jgi:hypothetical protein